MKRLIALLVLAVNLPALALDVRVKDVATFRGARPNQLVGYGLVVGLAGTGDSPATLFTNKALVNMMERLGMENLQGSKVKNVAGVLVTATLPAFMKSGQTLDVTISSLGDAKSLESGVLVRTPLAGPDGRVYAVAQGPVSLGGFGVEASGSSVKKNSTTVGRIPNGGIIEKEVPVTLVDDQGFLYIELLNPDFTTANELSDKINKRLLGNALALDAATVRVYVPSVYREDLVGLIAQLENLSVAPANQAAKIVIEERTGTLIIGQNVRIGPVAVTHGGLTVRVDTSQSVSQPNPLSNGQTTTTTESEITATEDKGSTVIFQGGTTIDTLVKSLNALGVPPRDLITIIQNIKATGALNAHLEII